MSENFDIPYASEQGTEQEYKSPPEKGLGDYAKDALHAAAYSGIQSPISAITQVLDSSTGSNTSDSLKFIEAPESKEAFSKDWHVQHVASAVGMVLPFIVARKGARHLLKGNAHRALGVEGASINSVWKSNAIKETAMAGFIYEAALHPSQPGENLLSSRFKQGLAGAATFGSLTKFSIGARSFGNNLAKTTSLGRALDNSIASTAIAGLPAGAISAQSNSILFEGELASGSNTVESAYAMSFVGAALAGAHKLPLTEKMAAPEPLAKKSYVNTPLEALYGKGSTGYSTASPLKTQLQLAKETVVGKAKDAANSLDVFLQDLATVTNPQGQLQLAMATTTPGRASYPIRVESMKSESLDSSRRGQRLNIESTGKGSGKKSKGNEATDRRANEFIDKERFELPGEGPIKASELLRDHHLGEIADFVEAHKSLRNLEVNPERVFHGNDALIVMEVTPSAKHPNGAVLKAIVPEGGWESNWGKRPGDAKILGKVHEVDMGGGGGSSYLYLQELVQVRERYETHLLDEYFRGIEKEGLTFEEPGNNPNKQFGISQESGKLVLIDYPSTGKPGHMQSLTEIIQGPEYFERIYEKEDAQRRNNNEPSEAEQIANSDGFRRETTRQEIKETRQLDEAQRGMLEQLTSGVKPQEVAELLALERGHFTKDGQIDLSKVQPEVDIILKIVKEEGLNID